MLNFITLCDGYKLGHKDQYPEGTEYVYSNFTARSTRVPGRKKVVFFGLQYFLHRYLMEVAEDTFFRVPNQATIVQVPDGPDKAHSSKDLTHIFHAQVKNRNGKHIRSPT